MQLNTQEIQLLEKLKAACGNGKTFSEKTGVSVDIAYRIYRQGTSFLRKDTLEKLRSALASFEETQQASDTEETQGIEKLVIEELQKMDAEDQKKVYRYCIELQVKG